MMVENREQKADTHSEDLKGLISYLAERAELSRVFITEKVKPVKQTIGELFTPILIEDETSNVVNLFPEDTRIKARRPDPRPPHVRILSDEEAADFERKKALTLYDQELDQSSLDDEVQ
jgi:hypothetical protein